MSEIFDKALAFILGPDIEGGFGCDDRDPGNWTSGVVGVGYMNGTKYGISAAAYPHVDIKNLTIEGAKEIYQRDFWTQVHGDDVGALGLAMFDEGINAGPRMAINLLQSALDIEMDGDFGPATKAAFAKADKKDLIIAFTVKRIIHYTLCNGWNVNKGGWVHRAVKAAILAYNLTGD